METLRQQRDDAALMIAAVTTDCAVSNFDVDYGGTCAGTKEMVDAFYSNPPCVPSLRLWHMRGAREMVGPDDWGHCH